MEVEVIIPHRSRWGLLERCLESLRAQSVVPAVCVVDNASEDDSVEALDRLGWVRVCAMDRNLGFGRAVNHGVRTSTADVVVLLNNDMVADASCIEELLAELQGSDGTTVTAAVQVAPDGRVDSIGVAIDRALCGYDVGNGRSLDRLGDEPLTPLGPSGGAAAFPRALFERVGGYDETIFAYLEDVDLAIRLHAEGITYRPALGARVVHAHSSTLGGGSRAKNRLMGYSRGYLLWKYRSLLGPADRARAIATDAVVYGGQLVMHRNAGALEGRWRFRRGRADAPAPGRLPGALPSSGLSFFAGLRRRRVRRT